jgi:uncharacterized integral membrane protein (TIGR00697 family)
MTNKEKIYTGLSVLFVLIVVLGNLLYQKFLSISVFSFYQFDIGAGAILYPLTFFITDLIAEFYGKEKASFCVKLAVLMNIVTIIIITVIRVLPAAEWSPVDDNLFNQVFGLYWLAFIASVLACYVSQKIDIILYLWIRKKTDNQKLWLRSNGSTAISLLIDTVIVITILTIFGIIPYDQMWQLIWHSYGYKLFFTLLSTPIFYLAFYLITFFINKGLKHA